MPLPQTHTSFFKNASDSCPYLVSIAHKDLANFMLHLERTQNTTAGMTQLPDKFLAELPHLSTLDLSYNEFLVVPEETENAKKLVEFIIDGNPMKDLSRNSFLGMNSLEILRASDMRYLERIEAGAFRYQSAEVKKSVRS